MNPKEAEKVRQNLLDQLKDIPDDESSDLKERIESMAPEDLETFVAQQKKQAPQMQSPADCLFCKIIHEVIPTTKIYEDSSNLAILDIAPASPGHVIVIPKKHYQFLFQLPEDEMLSLMKAVNFLSEIVVNVTESHGLSVLLNMGPAAMQRVPHVAFNLIPRHEDDNLNLEWDRKEAKKEDIQRMAEKLKTRVSHAVAKREAEASVLVKEKDEKKMKEEKTEAEHMLKHVKRRVP